MHKLSNDLTTCQLASVIACKYHNVPYLWGGDNPQVGLDCSGFVGAVLRRVGVIPQLHDNTSQGYFRRFEEYRVAAPYEGCLVFYGKKDRISHVMFCLNSQVCIGAVGGNSKTISIEIANKRNAYVDYRPIDYRRDVVAIVDPFESRGNAPAAIL